MWENRHLMLTEKETAQKRAEVIPFERGAQLASILPFSTITLNQDPNTNSTFDEPRRRGTMNIQEWKAGAERRYP